MRILSGLFWYQLLVFIISSLFVGITFSEILLHPNSSLFGLGGDGIKNYYTYLYQVKHGVGTQFQGMNYPFGEHVVFTDNMPLLVWIINWLENIFPSLPEYALGILHISLFLSIPIGCIYMFKILSSFGVSRLLSVICSICIVVSCQQYMKIEGHFGMAYLCYIPMILYWMIQYSQQQKLVYPILIFTTTIVFSFFHFYNLALTSVLVGFYCLAFHLVYLKRNLLMNLKFTVPLLLSFLLPTIIIKIFLGYTDPIIDRPDYPYGVFSGATEGKHIFLNNDAPLGHVFQFLFGRSGESYGEGSVYIGLVSICTSLFWVVCLCIWGFGKNRKTKNMLVNIYDSRLTVWLITALFALLLGMGVPISWGWESLIDHMSVIRQFRTVGRFSWIFYFILQIFVVITIYNLYKYLVSKEKEKLATIIASIAIVVATIQSSAIYFFYQKNPKSKQNNFSLFSGMDDSYNLDKHLLGLGVDIRDYQAILSLPYFHVGSEKIWISPMGNYALPFSFSTSYLSGLPIMDVMMSRTSWRQTFQSVSLLDGPFANEDLLDLIDEKPILVIADTQYTVDFNEKFILSASTFLTRFNRFDIYSLCKRDIKKLKQNIVDSVVQLALNCTEMEGVISENESKPFLYVNHFDDGKAEGYIGSGFYEEQYEKNRLLDLVILPTSSAKGQIICNLLSKVNDYKYNSPAYFIDQFDKDSNLVHQIVLSAKTSTCVMPGIWMLMEKAIDVHPDASYLTIRIDDGNAYNRNYLCLDELVFYSAGSAYFFKVNGLLYLNNRQVK